MDDLNNDNSLETDLGVKSLSKGQGSFAGDVAVLGGGAVAAHLIAFGCAPIVSRLFAPEAFGAAAIFVAITVIIVEVSSLDYDRAILLHRTDSEAVSLLVLSLLTLVAVTGIVCLVVGLFGDAIGKWFKVPSLATYKRWFPFAVFAGGLNFPLRYWYMRHKRFKKLAALNVAETFTSFSGSISAGAAGFISRWVLIITRIFARCVPS